jgi:hypothetical protein
MDVVSISSDSEDDSVEVVREVPSTLRPVALAPAQSAALAGRLRQELGLPGARLRLTVRSSAPSHILGAVKVRVWRGGLPQPARVLPGLAGYLPFLAGNHLDRQPAVAAAASQEPLPVPPFR